MQKWHIWGQPALGPYFRYNRLIKSPISNKQLDKRGNPKLENFGPQVYTGSAAVFNSSENEKKNPEIFQFIFNILSLKYVF